MKSQTKLTRLVLSAAIAATLASGAAMAQDTNAANQPPVPAAASQPVPPPPEAKADASQAKQLDQVVVTGNAANGGLKKIDTSYNITVANEEAIKLANPKSTADLLKISPGLWPESTGGQTGANIEIAGFPGGGDAPYFTTQLMGSPLYGMPTLSFFETTSLFRLDDTVQSVEILQGGPSVVFADGQIGASLDATLTVHADTATQAALAESASELRFFFITSEVIIDGLDARTEGAERVELAEGEVWVRADVNEDVKCVRCWHHRPDVGIDPAHAELCGRCVENVTGQGEDRRWF